MGSLVLKKKLLEHVLKGSILISISCYAKGNVTEGYNLTLLNLWYSEAIFKKILAMDKYINIVVPYKAV